MCGHLGVNVNGGSVVVVVGGTVVVVVVVVVGATVDVVAGAVAGVTVDSAWTARPQPVIENASRRRVRKRTGYLLCQQTRPKPSSLRLCGFQ